MPKGFYIEITNNLLDPKHRKAMKESVWLFMWCLDKMTSITEEGIGKVLGGKPIKYPEIKDDLGISEATYNRWVRRLKEKGYINAKRTPYGLILSVNKAKKRWGRKCGQTNRDPSKMMVLSNKKDGSNKTIAVDINNNVIIKKIGNERLEIPVGDPPDREPDPAGLKKYQQMKTPILKKLSMAGDKERTEIQEEVAPLIRKRSF